MNSACVKKGILQNLHKTSFEGSQKKKTIKKNCEVPIWILVDEYTRCRFLLLLEMGTLVLQWKMSTSIDWTLNLLSSTRRPSLASIPESIPLSTTKSDNCDWKVNNYKQTNIALNKRLCYVRDFPTQVSSKWAFLIWKFYFTRTQSQIYVRVTN